VGLLLLNLSVLEWSASEEVDISCSFNGGTLSVGSKPFVTADSVGQVDAEIETSRTSACIYLFLKDLSRVFPLRLLGHSPHNLT